MCTFLWRLVSVCLALKGATACATRETTILVPSSEKYVEKMDLPVNPDLKHVKDDILVINTDVDACTLSPDGGTCSEFEDRYFYNQYTKECEKFVYGGCQGNSNNFKSYADCFTTCMENLPIYYDIINEEQGNYHLDNDVGMTMGEPMLQ